MRRWIREVFPSPAILLCAAVIYLLMALLPYCIYYGAGGTGHYEDAWKFGMIPLGLFSVIYSLYRVVAFHPKFNPRYLEWLRQTPWTYKKPLPDGPLRLVSQDAVFVGILTVLAWWHQPLIALLIPALFIVSRVFAWEGTFLYTRLWKHAYVLAFVASFVIPCVLFPAGLPVVIALLYVITRHGLSETLRSFDDWSGRNHQVASRLIRSKGKSEPLLGWPYDRMAPTLSDDEPSFGWSVAISVLVAWWAFLIVAVFCPHETGALMFACLFAGMIVIVRLALYLAGYSAPLSFWGRLQSGQFVLPGFDVVWLASVQTTLLTVTAITGAAFWVLPYSVAVAMIMGGALFIGFRCPPDLNEWKLTGNHRIVPGIVLNASDMLQTQ